MNFAQIKDGNDWICLKVFRTFTTPVKVEIPGQDDIYIEKVYKIRCYNEYFLKSDIVKIEPNIYSKNKPPAKNSCIIFYRGTNQMYKVKGSKEEVLSKLNENKNIKAGFKYGTNNAQKR